MPTTAEKEVRDELDVTGMINGKKVRSASSVRSLRAHKKSLIYLGFFSSSKLVDSGPIKSTTNQSGFGVRRIIH